jgi:hypothetical protein
LQATDEKVPGADPGFFMAGMAAPALGENFTQALS